MTRRICYTFHVKLLAAVGWWKKVLAGASSTHFLAAIWLKGVFHLGHALFFCPSVESGKRGIIEEKAVLTGGGS
jgi:hypothetical protein